MARGALLLHDVFLEDVSDFKLDSDYEVAIKPDGIQGPHRNLMAAIVIRAIKDAIGKNKLNKDSAREWLSSDNNHISSFKHVCDVLDLDAQKVRGKIKIHMERKDAGLPGTLKIPYLCE